MAAKKKKKGSRKRKSKGAGFAQKLLVTLSFVVLILCVASATWSFFIRRADGVKGKPFTIEILNGVGQPGIAHEAKRVLLQRGIDVIAVANAPRFDYEESVLIARKRGSDVERLGEVLGCRNVVVQIKEDSIEDASLILGADYRSLNLGWDDD
jgi:hypothetical protein